MRRTLPSLLASLTLAAPILGAGCGGDDEQAPASVAKPADTTTSPRTATTPSPKAATRSTPAKPKRAKRAGKPEQSPKPKAQRATPPAPSPVVPQTPEEKRQAEKEVQEALENGGVPVLGDGDPAR